MSRSLRIEFPLPIYHIMNRGLAYREVFTDHSDCDVELPWPWGRAATGYGRCVRLTFPEEIHGSH